jgi:hypothetical protein
MDGLRDRAPCVVRKEDGDRPTVTHSSCVDTRQCSGRSRTPHRLHGHKELSGHKRNGEKGKTYALAIACETLPGSSKRRLFAHLVFLVAAVFVGVTNISLRFV